VKRGARRDEAASSAGDAPDRVVYVPPEAWSEGGATITGSEHHHLARVLRFRRGDRIAAVDGDGGRGVLEIAEIGRDATRCVLIAREAQEPRPRIDVEIASCITRAQRMDWLVEKATELGVSSIAPLYAERSVVRRGAREEGGHRDRWERLAVAAMKQSRQARKPSIREPLALPAYLAQRSGGTLLAPWERAGRLPLRRHLRERPFADGERVAVLIGPEGGLTDAEALAIESAGGRLVSLGNAILRAETAAVVALAAILYEGEVL
jgi:16S rRNA (uracil1498-N3)-methyltransferase